jgi:hypothetical protein
MYKQYYYLFYRCGDMKSFFMYVVNFYDFLLHDFCFAVIVLIYVSLLYLVVKIKIFHVAVK